MRSSGASAAPRSRPSRSACARGRHVLLSPPRPPRLRLRKQAGVHCMRASARPNCRAAQPAQLQTGRAQGACCHRCSRAGAARRGKQQQHADGAPRRGRAQAGAAPRTPRAISGRACATWPGVATTSWPACSSASRCAAGVSAASALTRRSAPQRAATASASSRTCPPQLRVSQGSHSLYGAPVRQGKRADRRVTCPGRETPNDSLPGHVKRQSA